MCHENIAAIGWKSVLNLDQPTLCYQCGRDLLKITGPICDLCGRPGGFEALCLDCERWNEDLFWKTHQVINRSIYSYNEGMKTILNQFKFRGDYALGKTFSNEMKDMFRREFKSVHIFSFIPVSDERLYERGFNQAEVLAKHTTRNVQALLTKRNETKQSKKSRLERIKGENPFEIIPSVKVRFKNILLVDDIYTTGTTFRHGAKILLENGASKVSSLTLIRS